MRLYNVFQSCTNFRVCQCTPAMDCFAFNQSYSLSNCNMMVEKENLAAETINITADVTNMAGLVTRVSMLVRLHVVSLQCPCCVLAVSALSLVALSLRYAVVHAAHLIPFNPNIITGSDVTGRSESDV